jgi:hypothetical protein
MSLHDASGSLGVFGWINFMFYQGIFFFFCYNKIFFFVLLGIHQGFGVIEFMSK